MTTRTARHKIRIRLRMLVTIANGAGWATACSTMGVEA